MVEFDLRKQSVNQFGFTANTPELIKKYKRLWYEKNRKRIKELYPLRTKECVICGASFRLKDRGSRAKTCGEECSKKNQHNWLKAHGWGKTIDYRLLVIFTLGAKCKQCGFNDIRALQLDHINGEGYKDSRKYGSYSYAYYKDVWKRIQHGSKNFQVLCANCNWIKRARKQEKNQWRSTNRKTFQRLLKQTRGLEQWVICK